MQQQLATSGNVSAATATATLAAVANMTWYITGFSVTVGGATALTAVDGTITGLKGGTMAFPVFFPTGATLPGTDKTVTLTPPLPASGVNTAVAISVPSGGVGNTKAAVNIFGYLA